MKDLRIAQLIDQSEELMRRSVLKDPQTGLSFFTGYSYRTLYDWDQYFEAIPQLYFAWGGEYIVNAIQIFLSRQNPTSGFIPRCVRLQGYQNPDPEDIVANMEQGEMVKPFLAQMGLLLINAGEPRDWLTQETYDGLAAYLRHWLVDCDLADTGLAVWRSAPHTGCDTQHERAGHWQSDHCAGVDLNAYLVRECRALALLAGQIGDDREQAHWSAEADRLAATIQEKLWDAKRGFFLDLDIRTGERIPVLYSASLAALWAGVATAEQAERILAEHLSNASEFHRPWRLPALAASEPGYIDRLPDDVGCGWRAHVWAPVNIYAAHALRQYGYAEEAAALAENMLALIDRAGLREYYTSESGEGCGLDPFWGWTVTALFLGMELERNFDPTEIRFQNATEWADLRQRVARLRATPEKTSS